MCDNNSVFLIFSYRIQYPNCFQRDIDIGSSESTHPYQGIKFSFRPLPPSWIHCQHDCFSTKVIYRLYGITLEFPVVSPLPPPPCRIPVVCCNNSSVASSSSVMKYHCKISCEDQNFWQSQFVSFTMTSSRIRTNLHEDNFSFVNTFRHITTNMLQPNPNNVHILV